MLEAIKNKLIKPLVTFLIERYFWLRNWQPIWFYLNREGHRLLLSNPPGLDENQKRIITDLKNNGLATTHLDELFPGENLLPALQQYASDLMSTPELKVENEKHIFLRYLLDKVPKLSFTNPFMALTLNQKILDIVNSYMGLWSKFYYFTLNVTKPMPKSADAVFSQNWHRDPEDKKICKMFIYLNDVDENAGPFIYVSGSQNAGKYGKLFPQKLKFFYPQVGKLENYVDKDEIRTCLGRAGTVLFTDTAGLHKGGYAVEKERIMSTSGFISNASGRRNLFKYEETGESELNPAARYALKRSMPKFTTRSLYFYKSLTRGD